MLIDKQHQDLPHPSEEKLSYAKTCKDKLGLKVTGVYCMPCGCSKVCVGQTGRSIKTGCKKYLRYTYVWASQKSPVWFNTDLKQDITLI
jgi:hypothetical protein